METYIYTPTEIKADLLLFGKYGDGTTNRSPNAIHESGNRVIVMAEQIKAERAVLGMNKDI